MQPRRNYRQGAWRVTAAGILFALGGIFAVDAFRVWPGGGWLATLFAITVVGVGTRLGYYIYETISRQVDELNRMLDETLNDRLERNDEWPS